MFTSLGFLKLNRWLVHNNCFRDSVVKISLMHPSGIQRRKMGYSCQVRKQPRWYAVTMDINFPQDHLP
jgi:hypothetical protein